MALHNFLENLGEETAIRHWPLIFHVILIVCELFQKGEAKAD